MTRLTLLPWLLVLIGVYQDAAALVEPRQTYMLKQRDSPQSTEPPQQTDVPQQTETAGLMPQATDASQQLNLPTQQIDSMPQPDMMQLVPVPLDMVEPGHTDEPQLRTWEMFFWGPDREFATTSDNPRRQNSVNRFQLPTLWSISQ